jgi:hypothetical protein
MLRIQVRIGVAASCASRRRIRLAAPIRHRAGRQLQSEQLCGKRRTPVSDGAASAKEDRNEHVRCHYLAEGGRYAVAPTSRLPVARQTRRCSCAKRVQLEASSTSLRALGALRVRSCSALPTAGQKEHESDRRRTGRLGISDHSFRLADTPSGSHLPWPSKNWLEHGRLSQCQE